MPPDTAPENTSDTFTSVLPGVEDVLECVYKLAEGGDTSIDEVVAKVRRRSPYSSPPFPLVHLPSASRSISTVQGIPR